MKNQHFPSLTDVADRLLCRPVFGIPFFFAVLSLVFFLSLRGIGGALSSLLETVFLRWGKVVSRTLLRGGVSAFAVRYLIEGVYTAVVSAIAFLPQTVVFFVLIRALRDCGYLSRAVLVTDRFFRIFGLSGNAVIPLLLGYGCAVSSVSACSLAPSEERAVTCALPFVPCNARVPVILFLADTFFPGYRTLAAVLIFALSFVLIFFSLLLSRAGNDRGAPLVAALPDYRLPRSEQLLSEAAEKSREYLARVSTAIFFSSAVFTGLSMLTPRLLPTETVSESILYAIAGKCAVIFRPLGFALPEAVSLFFGFFAKENIIGVMEIMAKNGVFLSGTVSEDISFMVFSTFYSPCFFLVSAEAKRSGTAKALFLLVRTLVIAYALSLIVYTLSNVLFGFC